MLPRQRSRNKLSLLFVSFFALFSFLESSNVLAKELFADRLVKAALELTKQKVRYDPTYFRIKYPGGDVPENLGVCTDVVIRAYRKLGIDLQQKVHEDIRVNFHLYPKLWGLKRADTNIDHRRVPNLEVFFTRFGKVLPISDKIENFKPGDLVTWNLSKVKSLPHIGIVTNIKASSGNPMIVHNIGSGQVLEDMLFKFKITGHFRYGGQETE